MDNSPSRIRQTIKRGFNLIEAAIVLGVVGLVLGGIWWAASGYSNGNRDEEAVSGPLMAVDAATSSDVTFTGTANYTPVDPDGDGVYEALVVDVGVEIATPGSYTVFGTLKQNGESIANVPAFEMANFTSAVVGDQTGLHTATLQFSGELIKEYGDDGPYDVELLAVGSGTAPAVASLVTPAYDHTQFGERDRLSNRKLSTSDNPSDTDSDGRYDYLVVNVEVTVLTAGSYTLQVTLMKNSSTVFNASEKMMLGAGTHTLSLSIPGLVISRLGENGPYEGVVVLRDASGKRQDDIEFLTQAYNHAEFEGLLDLTDTFKDQGIDTN